MDAVIRKAQLKLLKTFAKATKTFALAGGTALELFYLKHRFSRDLDFFSPDYNIEEINELVAKFSEALNKTIRFEDEFITPRRTKVRFYTTSLKGTDAPLKIDFVEDVFFKRPNINKFNRIPVYDIKDIYFQKIITLVGTYLKEDEIGRQVITGRKATRDIVDIYYLSKKVQALHKFIKTLNRQHQRGMVQWYRSYSRQELKLGVLDLDIYDKNFDISEIIRYLDDEMKKFMYEVLE